MPKGIEHDPQLTEEQKKIEQSRAVYDKQYEKDARRTGLTKEAVMREDAWLEDADKIHGYEDHSKSALTAKETIFSKIKDIVRSAYSEKALFFPKTTYVMEGVIEGKNVRLKGEFPGLVTIAESASGTVDGKPISEEKAKDLLFEYLDTARGREDFLKYIYKTLKEEQEETREKKD